MCYGEGGGGGGESLNRGNRLFLRSWHRNSTTSKLRRRGEDSEEVVAISQAKLNFVLQTLFQTCLKPRKPPKASVRSLPPPEKHIANGEARKNREPCRFALDFTTCWGQNHWFWTKYSGNYKQGNETTSKFMNKKRSEVISIGKLCIVLEN